VSTLAAANALLYPENREKLIFRQRCQQMASKEKRSRGANETSFNAIIQSKKGALPKAINSGIKLARYFFGFAPISAGLETNGRAFVEIEGRHQLRHLIQSTNKLRMPCGQALSMEAKKPAVRIIYSAETYITVE
jgi:hypothetical protein